MVRICLPCLSGAKKNPVKGYNDFYQGSWDYSRRYNLYEALIKQEQLDTTAIDYFEFGVCGGHSFKWWLEKNTNTDSKFYGFDTFEGLPENWGAFKKGSMAVGLESLNITDTRATFYKGLFQDTLIPFLENYKSGKRKLIHMDADLFSATIVFLLQCLRPHKYFLTDQQHNRLSPAQCLPACFHQLLLPAAEQLHLPH